MRGFRGMTRYLAGRIGLYVVAFVLFGLLVAWPRNDVRECGRMSVVTGRDFFYGPARTTAELVETTRLVVVGTFEAKTNEVWEYSYDHERLKSVLGPDFEFYAAPATYYRFRVDEVVYDEDGVASPHGEIELRYGGHEIDGCLFGLLEAPDEGERRILVLGGNPDGSFAPITLYHEFDIGGSHVRYVTGLPAEREVQFVWNDEPRAFIDAIVASLARRGPSPVLPIEPSDFVPRPIAPRPPSTP